MATRQNQRREDEEKPEGRAIDRLAQQRGKQLAADKKAQDDAEAAKKAAKPAAQQADKDGKKILAQNDADAVARLPESPRVGDPQRVGGTRVVTQDKIEEKDERRFVRGRDEWNRQKRIEILDRMAREDEARYWKRQEESGSSEWRFTTRMSNGKARTVGRAKFSNGRNDNRGGAGGYRSPFAEERDRLLNGDGAPDGRGGSSFSSRTGRTLDWMPQDTSKDAKQRFGAADFFGRENRGRSSRYAGGYLSAEFRENFINSRMEGLNPGDAGYDAMRRKAEGAWGQAVKQYDRQFMQFGQEKLREQSRLDFQQRRKTMLKQQEEARQKQAEEQKQADDRRQRLMESRGVKGYDPDAKPQGSVFTNRELEQSAAEAVRRSAMQTGVEARIVIGSGANVIAASGGTNGRSTTWITKNDANAQQFLGSKHGLEMYGGRGTIVNRTAGTRRGGLQVGDAVGGTEMNTARRDQDAKVARMARTDEVWKQVPTMDAGTFEFVTGIKREESRVSSGGRYAGGGTIVFGDQKTFDAAVAQNQKRMRGVA